MSLDDEEKTEEGRSKNGASHNSESLDVSQLAESKTEPNGSSVSSGSDNTRDGSSGWGIDVRDNSVSGSFSGLNKEREEYHDGDGSSQGSGVGENQNKGSLAGKKNGVDEDTSSHSHASVESVTEVSSSTTGKQVHPSEDRSNGGGRLGGLSETFTEVKGGGVVHGKLNTEAAGILDEKKPSVDVESSTAERGGGRNFGHDSVLLQFVVVSLGTVVSDEVDNDSRRKGNNSGNNADSSPGLLGVVVEEDLEKGEEGRSHDKLRDTSSKVSPSSDKGVGSSDDLLGEHLSRPVLAHDEGSSGNTNEKTKDGESGGAFDETSTGSGDRGEAEDGSEKNTGTELVTGRSKNETHEDGSTYTDNVGGPKLFLGEIKSVLDLSEKRSNGEPNEKGNEKAPPRAVEGTHVGAGEVAKLDLSGLVVLVGIDVHSVSIILLPSRLCKIKEKNREV